MGRGREGVRRTRGLTVDPGQRSLSPPYARPVRYFFAFCRASQSTSRPISAGSAAGRM